MAKAKKLTEVEPEPVVDTTVRGYKIFNPDFTCRGVQFSENGNFKMDSLPIICQTGFHFCLKASNCFSYYSFDSNNIVCEVEAIGQVVYHNDDSKAATNDINIGRRLTWQEVLAVANEGKDNTGHSNTGNRNTGDSNTGDSNTGNRNTGDSNTGDSNTGDSNTGDSNTGDSNTGNRNTGNRNTGNRNTGYSNTGDSNTGDSNTGDSNTGYSNTGNRNTGAFCTGDAPFPMFNKPSDWTELEFLDSRAYFLMRNYVNTKLWVPEHAMTEDEKKANKGWKAAEGYVKDIPFKEAFQNAWHNWSEANRKAFRSLPNFDASVFEEITGVKAD